MGTTFTGHSGIYRQNNLIEKLVLNKWFWIAVCLFMFGYPVTKSIYRQLPNALPVYHAVPDFSFTNEEGKTMSLADLKGKVWLVHVMSTNCTGECSLSFQQMQLVQHRIRGVVDRAAIISISVDPKTDTPSVLYSKARELKANPVVWRFVTGTEAEVRSFLVDGLKIPTQGSETAQTEAEAVKAHRLTLVDQEGNVRGYYVMQKNEINQLMIDLGLLINRKKS